jgi:hypothetical protein
VFIFIAPSTSPHPRAHLHRTANFSTPTRAAAELAEAKANVNEFTRGVGGDLHRKLAKAAASNKDTSYVKPHWDAMYLEGR